MKKIRLSEFMDISVLQKIQDGFSQYTGMAALITDEKGEPITEGSGFTDFCMELTRSTRRGCERCSQCDKEGALESLKTGLPCIYYCHAGLVDFAAPIMIRNHFVGCFIGGQIRAAGTEEEDFRKVALDLGIDPESYVAAAKRTSIMEKSEIDKAAMYLMKIANVVSEMAYHNYKVNSQSNQLERTSKMQTSYMTNMMISFEDEIEKWKNQISNAINSDDKTIMMESLNKLLEENEQIFAKINDTVEYIQLSMGDISIVESVYESMDLVRMIEHDISGLVNNGEVQVRVSVEDDVPRKLFGDMNRINQVISKIVAENMNYIKTGVINIKLYMRNESYATFLNIEILEENSVMTEKDLDIVKNLISDNSKKIPKIGNTKDSNKMNMAIIRYWIECMSGKIDIESEVGRGTKFHISIPQLQIGGEKFGS